MTLIGPPSINIPLGNIAPGLARGAPSDSGGGMGGIVAQRIMVIGAGEVHNEIITAGSIKIIVSSNPNAVIEASFDDSQWITVALNSFIGVGRNFSRVQVRPSGATALTVQFGASFIG